MAKRPGHKRGCRCVGCSPATRKRGLKALRKALRNPRRKRQTARNPQPSSKLSQLRRLTEVNTWFERDRQHVDLRWKRNGESIFDLWDEAVSEAVEDGFLNPKDWHGSAVEYANDMGAFDRKKNPGRKRAAAAPRSRRNPDRDYGDTIIATYAFAVLADGRFWLSVTNAVTGYERRLGGYSSKREALRALERELEWT